MQISKGRKVAAIFMGILLVIALHGCGKSGSGGSAGSGSSSGPAGSKSPAGPRAGVAGGIH